MHRLSRSCYSILARAVCSLSGILLLTVCQTDEILQTNENPDLTVRVLFSTNGLGDRAYNDDILRSILREKEKLRFRLQYLSPPDMDEAERIIRNWQAEDNDPERYFTIIAGAEFETVTRKTLPETIHSNYVMFETAGQGFTIPSFSFCGYGSSFLAGIAAYTHTEADTVAYMGGQQGKPFIEECYKGFRDGYVYAGGHEVVPIYISNTPKGFSSPLRAYTLADSLYHLYPFIYAIAGGSNNGLYEFLREHPEVKGFTNGVDVDQSAYSDRIIGSMIKHAGECIGMYIRQWANGEAIPHYKVYGLRSGIMDFQVPERYKNKLEPIVKAHFELAVKKENEYETNR